MNSRPNAETLPKPVDWLRAGPPERTEVLCFAGYTFDVCRGELRDAGGKAISLRPKADLLLRQFLAQPGRLLGRDLLMAALWPDTVVTDDSLVQCVGELRSALDDRGQQLVRTVPRRGYRFEAAITAAVSAPPVRQLAAANEPPAGGRRWTLGGRRLAVVAAILGSAAIVVAVAAWVLADRRFHGVPRLNIDEAIAARATVAILPFAVRGDDPALRRAAEAIEDEIAAQFATRRGMRGLGRRATEGLAGVADPLASAAKTLRATHATIGSVGRLGESGDGLTVEVQLIVIDSREVLWARRVDTTAAAVATGQSLVGLHVVNAMRSSGDRPELVAARIPPGTTDPVELTLLGWNDLDRHRTHEDVLRARRRFEQALVADPESLLALNGLSATFARETAIPSSEQTSDFRRRYRDAVERGIAVGPDDGTALLIWAAYQMYEGRPDLALPAADKSLRIVPSYANGHTFRCLALMLLGRTEEVQAEAERAVALRHADPRAVGNAYLYGSEAAVMRGDDLRALELARHAVVAMPTNPRARATLAAAEALGDRSERASAEMAEVLRLRPGATIAWYEELRRSSRPDFIRQRERFHAALRKAGLPEQ